MSEASSEGPFRIIELLFAIRDIATGDPNCALAIESSGIISWDIERGPTKDRSLDENEGLLKVYFRLDKAMFDYEDGSGISLSLITDNQVPSSAQEIG